MHGFCTDFARFQNVQRVLFTAKFDKECRNFKAKNHVISIEKCDKSKHPEIETNLRLALLISGSWVRVPDGAPKKALRKRKAFFIMIAALCECFHLPLTSTQVSGSFCFVGEKFIHPPGDATTAANGSGGSFLLPCTAAICYTKEKNRRGGTADDPHCNRRG